MLHTASRAPRAEDGALWTVLSWELLSPFSSSFPRLAHGA